MARKSVKGVENVYTQHAPLLTTTLEAVARGRLPHMDYPFVGGAEASPTAAKVSLRRICSTIHSSRTVSSHSLPYMDCPVVGSAKASPTAAKVEWGVVCDPRTGAESEQELGSHAARRAVVRNLHRQGCGRRAAVSSKSDALLQSKCRRRGWWWPSSSAAQRMRRRVQWRRPTPQGSAARCKYNYVISGT